MSNQHIKEYPPTSACIKCNEECCRQYSGILSPEDLDKSDEICSEIKKLLLSGMYAVDWWEQTKEMDQTYFLRPAHTNAIGKVEDPSWGGTCVFYNDNIGCSLPFKERPIQCRSLEPREEPNTCITHLDKIEAVKLWIPYQKEIARCLAALP